MEKQLRDKWVAALRSGKYQQGRERLKMGEKYCCLGVLCDVIRPNGWFFDKSYGWKYNDKENFARLDTSILDEINLSGDTQHSLIELNDTKSRSFDQIADWIEERIPVESSTEEDEEFLVRYIIQCKDKKYVGRKSGYCKRVLVDNLSFADMWSRKCDATNCIRSNNFRSPSVIKITLKKITSEAV